MEPESKMETGPPKVIEAIVRLLVPPACREHVLGDLRENYESPFRYIREALGLLPFVLISRIRRTWMIPLLLVRTGFLYLSFLGVAASAFVLFQSHIQLRLLIPVAAGVIALILSDAYASPASGIFESQAWDAAFVVMLVFMSEAVLYMVAPGLILPRRVLVVATGLSALMLSWLRGLLGSERPSLNEGKLATGAKIPVVELNRESHRVQLKIWWLNVAWMLAIYFIQFRSASRSLRSVGAIFVIAYIYLNYRFGRLGIAPWQDVLISISARDQRSRIERRRDTLRYWSLQMRPILVMFVAFPASMAALLMLTGWYVSDLTGTRLWSSFAPFAFISLLWFLRMTKLSQRAAQIIQQELDVLDGLEDKQ